MNADKRGWVLAMCLAATFSIMAMAPHAKGEEPRFLLTPHIEQLGGDALALDQHSETDGGASLCVALECKEFQLADVDGIESPIEKQAAAPKGFRVAPGVRVKFSPVQFVPAPGETTPLPLDFQVPPSAPETSPPARNWTIASVGGFR